MRDTRGKGDRAWILAIPPLPAPARHIMHVLLSRADAQTGVVSVEFAPSLTELAGMTGLDRSTVRRQLNHLEEAGWAVRNRPDVADARLNGTPTWYELKIPGRQGVGDESPHPGDESPHVEAEGTDGRGAEPLIPSSDRPDLDQPTGDDQKTDEGQQRLHDAIAGWLHERTGRPCPPDWAPKAARCIFQTPDGTPRQGINDPYAYAKKAIFDAADPVGRFYPSIHDTPTSPDPVNVPWCKTCHADDFRYIEVEPDQWEQCRICHPKHAQGAPT